MRGVVNGGCWVAVMVLAAAMGACSSDAGGQESIGQASDELRRGCRPGFADCDHNPANGCETNITNNPRDCGACGHVCSLANATAGCSAATCTIASCHAGFADCDGLVSNGCETNVLSSSSNCGACGQVCATVCTAGVCF